MATTPEPGWRSGAEAAAVAAVGDPGSWVLGLLGFLVRGGVVLVLLPVVSIPSPVLLSMLFRGEVGMVGRGEVRLVAIGVGVALSIVAIVGVIVSAFADVALAERFVRDPESEALRRGRAPEPLDAAARRSLVWWVASVQAVALLPVIGVVAVLVDTIVHATTDELLIPSSTHLPLVVRVASQIGPQVLLAAVVLVVVEALSSLATRRLMAHAWGFRAGDDRVGSETRIALAGAGRIRRAPGRVVATALTGWVVIAVVVAFVLAVTALAWETVRDVLIGGLATDAIAAMVAGLLVLLFVGVWVGGLGLIGFASALRSGLWTADALR